MDIMEPISARLIRGSLLVILCCNVYESLAYELETVQLPSDLTNYKIFSSEDIAEYDGSDVSSLLCYIER